MVNLYDTLAHLGIVLYRDMEMTIPVDDIWEWPFVGVTTYQGFKSRAKAFSGGAAKMMFSGL
jgi:hypothetical protein